MRRHFKYLRPATGAEAVEMKATYGSRSKYWAGGTDLLLQWQRDEVDFDYCIDLTFVPELRGVKQEDDLIRIGATTPLGMLERAGDMHPLVAYLGGVARRMCTPQTRTLATVGGNLCNASPAADLAPPLIALDATARALGRNGIRTIPVADFAIGVNRTALIDDELLFDVTLPTSIPRSAGFERIGRTAVDIALVVAAASVTASDGKIDDARVSLGAIAPTPLRCATAEQLLVGARIGSLNGLLDKAAAHAAEETRPISDIRTTAEYRRHVSRVLVRRALEQAIAEARTEGGSQ